MSRRSGDRRSGPQRRERPLDELASVRRASLAALIAADREDRFISEHIEQRREGFDARDRHLLQELAYGTTRHRGTIDHLLKPYLKVAMRRQRPVVRWALRLAAYQLVYLDRIPAHAAVHHTLEAAKALEQESTSDPDLRASTRDVGFLNAVLRRLADDIHRKTKEPPENPDDPTALPTRSGWIHFRRPVVPLLRLDLAGHLAHRESYPLWAVQRWLERLGEEECRQLLAAGNRIPPLTVRVTARAPSIGEAAEALRAEGFEAGSTSREDALALTGGPDLAASSTLAEGWVQVQDVTSMGAASALAPPSGARILDLCAAPGGKAIQLLESAGDQGHLTACDRGEAKLATVRANLDRAGLAGYTLREVPADPEAIDLGGRFTHILVDAPCSNSGVLARRPDARWRLGRESLASLSHLQDRLLEAAWRHLEPGGRLVYSTCSIEPEENEERVAALCRAHPELTELETRLTLPHRGEGDGGFFSLLRRERETAETAETTETGNASDD